MSEFTHSAMLFSGDDGLPLEFNVQYAKGKADLKPLIEYGGGLCTLSDNAIYLVSPGTAILIAHLNKKNLINTSYVYDCVEQNYLLDADDYRFVINEMEISDISSDTNSQSLTGDEREQKSKDNAVKDSVDIVGGSKTVSPTALICPRSNHDFDFLHRGNPNKLLNKNIENIQDNNPLTVLKPAETCNKRDVTVIEIDNNETNVKTVPGSLEGSFFSVSTGENNKVVGTCHKHDVIMIEKDNNEPNSVESSHSSVSIGENNAVPDSLEGSMFSVSIGENNAIETRYKHDVIMIGKDNNEPNSLERSHSSVSIDENKIHEVPCVAASNQILNGNKRKAMELNASVDAVIVPSSQPNKGDLDQFDKMVLGKAQGSPVQKDDEDLSQSYTVSSSADTQVSPKAPISNISAEIFDKSPSAPDSQSQTTEPQQYINDLDKEIEQILQKPSPKSIQDKITLVKYICLHEKLPPAVVLHTLQRF